MATLKIDGLTREEKSRAQEAAQRAVEEERRRVAYLTCPDCGARVSRGQGSFGSRDDEAPLLETAPLVVAPEIAAVRDGEFPPKLYLVSVNSGSPDAYAIEQRSDQAIYREHRCSK